MKKLEKSEVAQITYEKDSEGGELTSRTVIPTYVPGDFVRTIDITDLSKQKQEEVAELNKQYQQYCDTILLTMFNFETWLEHTQNIGFKPKWRTFKLSKLTVI